MRIGVGNDVHRLVKGRPLILGGIKVPFDKGLAGHSDADVLVHAIGDAVLGAIGLGDLGRHFPDNDVRYKDISSLKLLAEIQSMAANKGYSCLNADATIVAQKPTLSVYIPAMIKNIASCLRIKEEMLNIKSTTTEGLGFEGRGEGISVYAVVLMQKAS
jgi:2-C-methyl-D-erythritol 2,4-cyclodiphosphate synthase